jgi:hypothetical protein
VKRLGHETSRTVKAADVTASRADIDARVLSLRASVDRLRDFMKHSGTINDLVTLESQLSQREQDLESTVAQQRALSDQIGFATLSVQLSAHAVVAAGKGGPAGFGSALGAGLHALTAAGRWAFAVVGYAVPFVLLASLIATPSLLIRRRRRPVPAEPVAEAG